MITIANPEKYIAGLYERLSNENIEVGNGEVIVTNEDEQESGSISTQKLSEDIGAECESANICLTGLCKKCKMLANINMK